MTFNNDKNKIIVAGHRGMRAVYPENTMLSFKKAIEEGVDQLEIDINMTLDKSLVIIHDTSVDRTTNGKGLTRDLTLNEIKQLDAGIFMGEKFKGERVPLLSELLAFLKNHSQISLNVEIKDKTFECVDSVVKMLYNFGYRDNFVLACWDANITQYAYNTYGVMTQGFPKEIFQNYSNYTFGYTYAVGIPLDRITKELVKFYESINIQAWAWCPDDEESVIKCINAGAKLLTCNDPRVALKVLREKGLHS